MGSVGAVARSDAQHLSADAAARCQHSRVHAVPTKVTTAFVAEATDVGIDIFRIFDALNNIEQMRPAIDAVRETGTAVAEVAMSYTGDLSNPAEELYARLLSAAGRADRRCRRAHSCDQGHGRAVARRRLPLWCRRCARSSTCRCTCTPRHSRWSARHLPGRLAGRSQCRRRRQRRAGRHDQSACAVGDRRRCRAHRTIPAWTWARCAISNRTGRPSARCTRRSSRSTGPTGRVYTTDPRRSAVQPAPAGHRARAG